MQGRIADNTFGKVVSKLEFASVVKKIAKEHGGAVEVESRPGTGTTFRLRLPAPSPTHDGDVTAPPGG